MRWMRANRGVHGSPSHTTKRTSRSWPQLAKVRSRVIETEVVTETEADTEPTLRTLAHNDTGSLTLAPLHWLPYTGSLAHNANGT